MLQHFPIYENDQTNVNHLKQHKSMKNEARIRQILSYSFKFNLAMKLTTLLLLVSVFSIQANTYSQNVKITCNLENVKITSVFEKIEKDTKFRFLYNHDEINIDRIVSLKADKEPLKDILPKLFLGTDITFIVRKNQIILKKEVSNNDGALEKVEISTNTGT